MIRDNRRQFRHTHRGIAMVEFVIVLPICLILLMATAEFGRAFMQYNTLTKAVRDDVPYDNIRPSKGVWILPIGAALIVFHLVVHAVIDAIYLANGRLPPESGDIQVH